MGPRTGIPHIVPRPAAPDDLDALAQLESKAFHAPWSYKALAAELAKNTTACWLLDGPATDARSTVAYACFQVLLDEAELLRIAVDPAARRQGLAHKLLTHGLEQLRQRGVQTCHLEVRADNTAAVGLYERLGFQTVGRRRGYYRDGADALLFSLAF